MGVHMIKNRKLVAIIHVYIIHFVITSDPNTNSQNSSSWGSGAQFCTAAKEEKGRAYLMWWVHVAWKGQLEV